jgi:hypothetical protein
LLGFTFVTGCLPCLRLLPTPPHGNAVTGHSPLNDVIGGDVVFIRGLWFLGARPKGTVSRTFNHRLPPPIRAGTLGFLRPSRRTRPSWRSGISGSAKPASLCRYPGNHLLVR